MPGFVSCLRLGIYREEALATLSLSNGTKTSDGSASNSHQVALSSNILKKLHHAGGHPTGTCTNAGSPWV